MRRSAKPQDFYRDAVNPENGGKVPESAHLRVELNKIDSAGLKDSVATRMVEQLKDTPLPEKLTGSPAAGGGFGPAGFGPGGFPAVGPAGIRDKFRSSGLSRNPGEVRSTIREISAEAGGFLDLDSPGFPFSPAFDFGGPGGRGETDEVVDDSRDDRARDESSSSFAFPFNQAIETLREPESRRPDETRFRDPRPSPASDLDDLDSPSSSFSFPSFSGSSSNPFGREIDSFRLTNSFDREPYEPLDQAFDKVSGGYKPRPGYSDYEDYGPGPNDYSDYGGPASRPQYDRHTTTIKPTYFGPPPVTADEYASLPDPSFDEYEPSGDPLFDYYDPPSTPGKPQPDNYVTRKTTFRPKTTYRPTTTYKPKTTVRPTRKQHNQYGSNEIDSYEPPQYSPPEQNYGKPQVSQYAPPKKDDFSFRPPQIGPLFDDSFSPPQGNYGQKPSKPQYDSYAPPKDDYNYPSPNPEYESYSPPKNEYDYKPQYDQYEPPKDDYGYTPQKPQYDEYEPPKESYDYSPPKPQYDEYQPPKDTYDYQTSKPQYEDYSPPKDAYDFQPQKPQYDDYSPPKETYDYKPPKPQYDEEEYKPEKPQYGSYEPPKNDFAYSPINPDYDDFDPPQTSYNPPVSDDDDFDTFKDNYGIPPPKNSYQPETSYSKPKKPTRKPHKKPVYYDDPHLLNAIHEHADKNPNYSSDPDTKDHLLTTDPFSHHAPAAPAYGNSYAPEPYHDSSPAYKPAHEPYEPHYYKPKGPVLLEKIPHEVIHIQPLTVATHQAYTNFDCRKVPYPDRHYADPEAGCKVKQICIKVSIYHL